DLAEDLAMPKPTDIRPVAAALYLLRIKTRMPLKFGPEVTTEVTCARVRMTVADRSGLTAEGWGETPLSVQWVWPSTLPYAARHDVLVAYCKSLVPAWAGFDVCGHPLEVGHAFLQERLTKGIPVFALGIELQNRIDSADPKIREAMVQALSQLARLRGSDSMPWLAALVCNSAFDLALHDAYGIMHGIPTYETYNARFMNADL